MNKDPGVRNLILVFVGVALFIGAFYSYLAWRALTIHAGTVDDSQHVQPQQVSNAESDHANVNRGRRVYLNSGCALCHGLEGKGQIKSPNYIKDTMPGLNELADRMFLMEPEDAETVIRELDAGGSLNAEILDLPRAGAVVAQYESIRQAIMVGNPGGKKDPAGVEPLAMPAWADRLSPAEVNDVIAYLLSIYPWDRVEQQ